ncbi:MAG TPA: nucleotide exchange factor GrpE, partial [Allocoleopsis sp.]
LDKFGYSSDIESLKHEYQRLQMLMSQQEKNLLQQFQQDSLQVLESFLIYFPTAVNKSQENPQLEAKKIIPLVKPVEDLIKQWGVEAIASVGAEISYDPQLHELISGDCNIGDMVKVRYVGYKYGEKLLYRAKVSLISNQ